jgi:glyoxalase family protein
VPESSLDYWRERLTQRGVHCSEHERFDGTVLEFSGPGGTSLELVFHNGDRPGEPWLDGPVPMEHQLRGFYGITLALGETGQTAELLEAVGFERVAGEGDRTRYEVGEDRLGTVVDLVEMRFPRGTMGVGTVHHVAFEVASDDQEALREQLEERGLRVAGPSDRKYFTAIYAREPGGVLFEFATPEPGFAVDEDPESLSERPTLPDWLEDERADIEASLPAFDWDPDRERTPTATED